ncbi:helix-turn-helix transcriptional regulator [Streptomyces roseicoloratus]|uniref:Helix-turn-helix transcriptional regulator n=1 Tax=Streptomyces roseicoloratus TaxID=2508722 RepID=A0ABY9S2Z6_9ACTN|nr:helix-turn-helix transcriptional regulator [Streptomyces roseicoloratus]WMX48771.1 helix-turn-helix transcriptional regulator [Streptomyces roseicoloratus]
MNESTQRAEDDDPAGDAAAPDPGSGILRVFGRQLKRFRVRAGVERAEFGARLGYSASTIAAYEQGRRVPPPRFIDQADELLDAGEVLKEMKEEVARAQYPAFFRDAAKLEAEAVELHVYATQVTPGLLQTEECARAVFGMWRPLVDEEIIEQRIAARLARQEIFSRRPHPHMSFVIEEAAIHKRLGGNQVWRGQLEHILLISQSRNIEIQVMPLDREEHAGLAGPFTLMELKDGRRIAYAEVQSDSRLHTERGKVRELEATYGSLRAQALTPWESQALIEKLLGDQ